MYKSMTNEKSYKLKAARTVNKYFSESKKLINEEQNIRGFDFLDNAKAFLSDVIPGDILAQLSNGSMYAEVNPSSIEVKAAPNDILNKSKEFYVVIDPASHLMVIVDGSGKAYVNQANSFVRLRRILQDLYKAIGDEGAYVQLGFQPYE